MPRIISYPEEWENKEKIKCQVCNCSFEYMQGEISYTKIGYTMQGVGTYDKHIRCPACQTETYIGRK
jgi:hypothetical protein